MDHSHAIFPSGGALDLPVLPAAMTAWQGPHLRVDQDQVDEVLLLLRTTPLTPMNDPMRYQGGRVPIGEVVRIQGSFAHCQHPFSIDLPQNHPQVGVLRAAMESNIASPAYAITKQVQDLGFRITQFEAVLARRQAHCQVDPSAQQEERWRSLREEQAALKQGAAYRQAIFSGGVAIKAVQEARANAAMLVAARAAVMSPAVVGNGRIQLRVLTCCTLDLSDGATHWLRVEEFTWHPSVPLYGGRNYVSATFGRNAVTLNVHACPASSAQGLDYLRRVGAGQPTPPVA